ncbi:MULTISPECIES: hypothetical protein [Candidatus Ichthyocystis]|uniref:Putative exported protein n=1 Tax=Candidatus Ichthyocystis hellenicum TaxID=1561003 RepID=A0A0S4M5J8_9BURK|nr:MULTISPECIES: hypothetical protein [Ichthyocystis]CUT17994.1 putative exported protein [Candidatus Ichthyocystis hellenicum]
MSHTENGLCSQCRYFGVNLPGLLVLFVFASEKIDLSDIILVDGGYNNNNYGWQFSQMVVI